uniref:Uncharacterized protein n=1 Tax=Oryza brachyantha TaxID=4533 RepID=J3LSX8_ORYBR
MVNFFHPETLLYPPPKGHEFAQNSSKLRTTHEVQEFHAGRKQRHLPHSNPKSKLRINSSSSSVAPHCSE